MDNLKITNEEYAREWGILADAIRRFREKTGSKKTMTLYCGDDPELSDAVPE